MSTPNQETTTDQPGTPPPAADENPLLKTLFDAAAPKPAQPDKGADATTKAAKKPSTDHGRSLHEVLAQTEEPKEESGTKPADAEKPAGDNKPPAAEVKEAPAAPKRVKVRRAPAESAPAPLPPPAPVAAEPPKADSKKKEDPEEGLLDEEKEILKLARFAEKKDAKKYAGRADKLTVFFKKNAEFIAKKQAEDPDYEFSEDNPEYKAFLNANRPPALSATEQRVLEREMIKEEVLGETRAELEKRQADDETKRTHEQLTKQHRQDATKFWRETAAIALPDELRAAMKEHGAEKAKELYPFEYDISEKVTASAAEYIEEFLLISSGVRKLDLSNPTHKGIADFITNECENFAKNGGEARVRGGKTFVSRADFQRLPPEQRGRYWTFSNAEIVELAKVGTKRSIAQIIKDEYANREKQGWVRAGKPASAKPAPEPTPSASARPAPSTGATPPEKTPPVGSGNPVMSILGLTNSG